MSLGPAALIRSIPAALGRTPAEEVVLVGVSDLSPAAAVIFCVDVSDATVEDEAEELAATIQSAVHGLSRDGARKVVVLVYADAAADPDSTPARYGATAVVAAEAAGLDVLDAIAVFDGRWRSYECDNPSCCPPEGTPIITGDPTP